MLSMRVTDDAELRALEPWLAAEFAAFVAEHREHLRPYIPFGTTIVDDESARAYLQRFADRRAADTGSIYGLWVGGRLAGGTLFPAFDAALGRCEIGVWLAPWATGRGLVTLACRRMIDWAFETRGMSRVEWRVVPHNAPSIAVARRLGMARDGVLRSMVPHDGGRHDLEIWSVVRQP